MRRRVLLSGGSIDYSDCFAMVVTTGGDITWSGSTTDNTLSYSKDNGTTWSEPSADITLSVNSGDKVLWKGKPTPKLREGIGKFSGGTNVKYSVEGNVMSLLYGDNFKGKTSLSGKDYALYRLFFKNTNIIGAENLSLPATTLARNCYEDMFRDCTSLTTAPELPATKLAEICYFSMFEGCTSLTTAPELPATTLANQCYREMFNGCTSLTIAPQIYATKLETDCCLYMFKNCTSLTTAPELPATKLAYQCYYSMFNGCTNLTTAPELPATTLAGNCYQSMFENCTSLTIAPELPATTLTPSCYFSMFYGCTSLTTAPELPATTLARECYAYMFSHTNVLPDCTNIDFSSQSVVESGSLKGLFAGTKITDAQLDVILKEHGINNYSLPATTLVSECYSNMFNGCTNLTTAPELPATTLARECYMYMFRGCTNLSSIKCLATDISANYCTGGWVNGVAANGTFTKAASMSGWTTGDNGIPSGWTVRNYVESVVLYPEDYDTPVSGYITSGGKWAKATSSGKQTWVFQDVTEFQGGTCNLYLGSRTGYYAFVKQIPTAAGSVQYASGWSNRATLSQDAIGIQIPSDAVYLCFYYHGSGDNMYPSKVEIYPQE